MKVYRTVKNLVEIREIDKCTCDFCLKTINGQWEHRTSEITEFSISPGYGSMYDTSVFNFDICDDCIDSVILKNIKTKVLYE